MKTLSTMTNAQKTAVAVAAATVVVGAYLTVCQLAWTRIRKYETELFADFVRDIPPEQRATF